MDDLFKGTGESLAARTSTWLSGYLPNSLCNSRVCCLLNNGSIALKAPEVHLPFILKKLKSRMLLKAISSLIFLPFESYHQGLFPCINVDLIQSRVLRAVAEKRPACPQLLSPGSQALETTPERRWREPDQGSNPETSSHEA